MLLDAVLLFVHIISAVGWLGAAMVFGILIGPLLPDLSAPSRSELIVNLFPRFVRYVQIFAIATIIFGLGLVFSIAGGDLGSMSPSTLYGFFMSTGSAVTILAIVIGFGIVVPSAHKLVAIVKGMQHNPGPPPPELSRIQARLRVSSAIMIVLLIVVLAFMVAAAIV